MSETITGRRGLDTMDASDLALLKAMQDESEPPASDVAAEAAPAAVPALEPEDEGPEILLEDEAPSTPAKNMIPLKALSDERQKVKAEKTARQEIEKALKEAEARAAEAERKSSEQAARFEERVNMLAELAKGPPVQTVAPAPVVEEPLPDVNVDPIGHFQKLYERETKAREQQNKEIADLRAIASGFQEQQQQARQIEELRQWGLAQEQSFLAKEPTYNDAMTYLRQNRDEELTDIGITDSRQRQQIINNDITQIALKARQDGANFAERLYKSAQRRGFAKASPAPTAATAADPVIPALDDETESRLARAEAARDNATTIGSVGAAAPVRLTANRIAEMGDKEFEAFYAKLKAQGGNALRDLVGH